MRNQSFRAKPPLRICHLTSPRASKILRSIRAVTREPPTLLYLPLLPPIANEDCNPLNHNSPHKDPPAEFVEEAARAADPSDAMEDDDDDDDEERILGSTLHDLVGGKRSGLDDLGYSSDDDDEDYDDGMKEDQYLNNVDDTLQYTVK